MMIRARAIAGSRLNHPASCGAEPDQNQTHCALRRRREDAVRATQAKPNHQSFNHGITAK